MNRYRWRRLIGLAVVMVGCSSADVSERGLFWASQKGDTRDVRSILDQKPELAKSIFPQENQRTPLHVAANAEIAQALLDHGADPFATDQFGFKPISTTASGEVVELLAKKGADINETKNNYLFATPLYLAIENNRPGAALALLRLNADALRVDRDGKTYLHVAAQKCTGEVAEALLKAGVRPESATTMGIYPLQDAVANNNLGVAEALLNHGANPNVTLPSGISLNSIRVAGEGVMKSSSQDVGNATPLSFAKSEEMKALLQKYGGH